MDSSVERIIKNIPAGTVLLKYNLGSDGKIAELGMDDMSNVVSNDILIGNIVIQAYLSALGIDCRAIASDVLEDTDDGVVDIYNILCNSDFEGTSITIDGESYVASEYIKERFHLYDKDSFVSALFRGVVDCVNASIVNEGYNIIALDGDTYDMIALLAYCWANNEDFSKVKIGEDIITNIEFDPNDIPKLKRDLASILVEKGYLDSSITSLVFKEYETSDVLRRLLSPVETLSGWGNLNGEYHYCHLMICLNSDNPNKWSPIIHFTKRKIDKFECDMWYDWGCRFRPKFYIDNEGELVHYSTEDHYIRIPGSTNLAMGANVQPFEYTDINSGNNDAKAKDSDWNVYIGGQDYRGYLAFNDGNTSNSSYEYLLENNININPAPTTHNPNIDSRTKNKLILGQVILYTPYNNDVPSNKFPIKLDKDGISSITRPTLTPTNRITFLKTDAVDIVLKVSLIDGKPLEKINSELKEKTYVPDSSTEINWKNQGQALLRMHPGTQTYYIKDFEYINNLISNLYTNGDTIFQSLCNLFKDNGNFMDWIIDIYLLPIRINKRHSSADASGVGEYRSTEENVKVGTRELDPVFTNNHPVKGHVIECPVKIFKSKPVYVGGSNWKEETGEDTYGVVTPGVDCFLDYGPNSSASVYIPFAGNFDIDIDLVMRRFVYLEYVVDITSGDFVATLYGYSIIDNSKASVEYIDADKRYKKAYPIITASGNMARHIPIVGKNIETGFSNIASMFGSALSASSGLGMASIIGRGQGENSVSIGSYKQQMAKGKMEAGNTMASNVLQMATVNGTATIKGGSSESFNILSNWNPYLTIMTHESIRGYNTNNYQSAFNEILGLKTERGIKIKEMNAGYHKLRGVKIDGLKCTQAEKDELYDILMSGFYTASKKKDEEVQ